MGRKVTKSNVIKRKKLKNKLKNKERKQNYEQKMINQQNKQIEKELSILYNKDVHSSDKFKIGEITPYCRDCYFRYRNLRLIMSTFNILNPIVKNFMDNIIEKYELSSMQNEFWFKVLYSRPSYEWLNYLIKKNLFDIHYLPKHSSHTYPSFFGRTLLGIYTDVDEKYSYNVNQGIVSINTILEDWYNVFNLLLSPDINFNINLQDNCGHTILFNIIHYNIKRIGLCSNDEFYRKLIVDRIKYLLEKGANPHIKNMIDISPISDIKNEKYNKYRFPTIINDEIIKLVEKYQ